MDITVFLLEKRAVGWESKGRTGLKSRYAPTFEKSSSTSTYDYLPKRHTRPLCILRLF
jgi:hypothetical protein